MARPSFEIGPVRVRPGRAQSLALPITRLVTGAEVDLPVRVVHGREDGPTVWIDAAIHGDEAVGVEVVRQVLADLDPRTLRGTLIAIPIVNVLGFMTGSRYLPDRRDLNRSFPGSARGSLAGRIAHLMMTEVVAKCSVGIDLHTGSDRRTNLPQIRTDLEDPETRRLAEAFAAPVMMHARLRDGSLRHAAREEGAKVLLYEAGEAWRMDPWAIDAGVRGVRRVLAALEMTGPVDEEPPPASLESWRSGWVRARGTGMLHLEAELGQRVEKGERLGGLFDSFGKRVRLVHADRAGIVVGRTEAPLVSSGDAVLHLAEVEP
ncbi:Succinylglutamate desuccinylase / Aspartoacylase family protein [Nocardioides dokdonensis FR1436]|uniref:Succinylglutamate desuccinylase / Aspartoacylase family protein n=1 Tax=Nocardioides dokdonensis FR1436 TaxID=1300347 RepID=A0A1A9GH97_9ACTN|nr:succinylglutamate desuccinylase/aspartoacylase family protein [Nocardioides dokdonensis]ANH37667.1 Succinylglutamate desuccinylase / Aspartoacylase family protein [Nocardioides dokdonensis FR1436]